LTKKDITIIIVTYKSTHIILDTLKNIVGKGYTIKIVDNGSKDNLEQLLKQNYPNSGIELILLTNNYGFGKANNIALEQTTTKYALILNPDAIITPTSIDNLVIEANKDQYVALASPFPNAKENPTKEEQQESINNYKKNIKIIAENDHYIQTNCICGGYMLMNMNVFQKIGFFDKNIFLYYEDVELSKRSIDNGYKNIVVKNSNVFHCEGRSTKDSGLFQNYKIFYMRNYYRAWSEIYMDKENKNIYKIILKIIYQFISSFACLLVFNNKFISKLAKSLGSASNLLGIDCFNKNNKIVKIKSVINI
jgi:GT2 family glycosyltransferase